MTNDHPSICPNGFARPGVVRVVGTTLHHSAGGVRAIRQKIHRLPPLTAALGWLISEVVQEARQDLPTSTTELHMMTDGCLAHRRTSTGYWFTPKALDQLLKLLDAPPHAGPYLAAVSPDRRATEVNHILRRNPDRPVALRLRRSLAADAFEVFSVVTPRYTPVDPDTVALRLLDDANTDSRLAEARAEVIYTGERTSIRLYHDSDVATEHLGLNETFASVLGLVLGDDKTSGIHVDVSALRNVCLNLMLVTADTHGLLRARHLGDPDQLTRQIAGAVTGGAELLPTFLETYRAASEVTVDNPLSVIEQLTGAAAGKKTGAFLQVPGIKPHLLAERITEAWHQETDPTQKGIANSITKAAHTFPWPTIWTGRELERQASLLLAMPEPRFHRLASPA